MPLAAAALAIATATNCPPARAARCWRWCAIWRAGAICRAAPPAELARTVLDESGYTAMLQAERSAESAGRLENLSELARAMEEYETLGDFLEHVSLVMDNEANADTEKVTIMTIHAAKGLEFDQVFLPGWEEGVFPASALDEGARLAWRRSASPMWRSPARGAIAPSCTPPTAASMGNGPARCPAASSASCPAHIASRTTLTGGASLWRAQWSERADPFAHVARDKPQHAATRGPGWQRAAQSHDPAPRRIPKPPAAQRGSCRQAPARHPPGRPRCMTSSAPAPWPRRKATSWRSTSTPPGANA
jgi:DNA helicase-2/ATP-dependent DNA helicase PcrA